MLRKILLCLTVAATTIAWGASPLPDEILQSSARALGQAASLHLVFTVEQTLAGGMKTKSQTGDFLMSGATRFRLILPGAKWVCDGKTLWQYNSRRQQVVVDTFVPDAKIDHPARILTRYLEAKPLGMAVEGRGKGRAFRLSLDPLEVAGGLDSLTVWISEATRLPLRAALLDGEGGRTVYVISKCDTRVRVRDADFIFHPAAGVEVIDKRE